MTGWFIALVYVAAVNPPRLRPGLDTGGERGHPGHLLVGSAFAAAIGLVLVLASTSILDVLDITDETWRLASGVVAVLAGARVLLIPSLGKLPPLDHLGIIPIAFPLLLTPQLVVLAVLFGATESFAAAWGLLAVCVAAGAAAGALRQRRPELWLATARLLGAVLVALGVALVVAGIRDV